MTDYIERIRALSNEIETQGKEIEALNEKIRLLNTDCRISSAYIKQLEADNSDLSSRCQYLFSLLPEEMQNRLILRSVALQKEKAQ
jgi:hypothetical protein